MNIWVLVCLVMAIEIALHYFPWRVLLRGHKLPRLAAYTLGLLGIMVPFSAWLWLNGKADVMGVLWLVVVSAGLTVFGLWGLDHYLTLIMRDIESSERDAVRKKDEDATA